MRRFLGLSILLTGVEVTIIAMIQQSLWALGGMAAMMVGYFLWVYDELGEE